MKVIPVYRYRRADGGTNVSPIKPDDTEFTVLYRLVADDGKAITNGTRYTFCEDVESADGWSDAEIPAELLEDDEPDEIIEVELDEPTN